MSEAGGAGSRREGMDPVLKFLGGCALVAGGLFAVVLLIGTFVGWRLVHDDHPGRPEEPFLTSADTSYRCLDLRPDDPALVATVERLQHDAESVRDEALKKSPIAGLPIPHRRAELERILPMRIEISASRSDASRSAWTARLSLTKAIFRIRAAVRLMRWIVTRDPENASQVDADGVPVTTLHGHDGVDLSVAMVGNRLLVASDADRLRTILTSVAHPKVEGVTAFSAPEERHAKVRRDGETGWGIEDRFAVADGENARAVETATASIRLGASGTVDLSIRVEGSASPGGLGDLGPDAARKIVARFFPGLDASQVVLAEGSPSRRGPAEWSIEGSIPDYSTNAFAALLKLWESAVEEHAGRVNDREAGRETPSASPSPSSPPRRSGPRTGTPEAPPHEGTPNPEH